MLSASPDVGEAQELQLDATLTSTHRSLHAMSLKSCEIYQTTKTKSLVSDNFDSLIRRL